MPFLFSPIELRQPCASCDALTFYDSRNYKLARTPHKLIRLNLEIGTNAKMQLIGEF